MITSIQPPQNIIRFYQQISEPERLIVQFCALLNTNNHGNSLIPYLKSLQTSKPLTDIMVKNLKRTEIINNQCRCNPAIRHQATLDALANPQSAKLIEGVQNYLSRSYGSHTEYALRLAIYLNDEKNFKAVVEKIQAYNAPRIEKFMQNLFDDQILELAWLKTRLVAIQNYIIQIKLTRYWLSGTAAADVKNWLPHYQRIPINKEILPYQAILTTHDIYTANIVNAKQRLDGIKEAKAIDFANRATLDFLTQQDEQALQNFNAALKLHRKEQQRRKVFLQGINGFFYFLAHLQENTNTSLYPLIDLAHIAAYDDYPQIHQEGFSALYAWLNLLRGDHKTADTILMKLQESQEQLDPLSFAMFAYVQFWQDKTKLKFSSMEEQFSRVKDTLPLIAILIAEVMEVLKPDSSHNYLNKYPAVRKILPLFNAISYSDVVLTQLEEFLETKSAGLADLSKRRLIWLVNPDKKTFHARIQTRGTRGNWNQGKRIPWIQLENYKSYAELRKLIHAVDKRIIDVIDFATLHGSHDYFKNNDPVWLAFAGHPRVFHVDNPQLLVEFMVQKPELIVEEIANGYSVQLSHHSDEACVLFEKETSNRYRLIEFSNDYLQLQSTLGKEVCIIPYEKKARLLQLIQHTSDKISINAAISEADLPTSAADPTLYVLLMPWQQGLKVNLLVKPAGQNNNYYPPGKGKTLILTTIDGIKTRLKRNMQQEQVQAESLIHACPILAANNEALSEWFFTDTESCLEVLDQLQQHVAKQDINKQTVQLEWPEGQTFKISRTLSFNDLNLQVGQWQQWFEINGKLAVDENQVIDLQTLLNKVADTPGRFIPLGNKQFLSLTQHFKKRLQELAILTDHEDNKTTFHPLAANALQEIFADAVHIDMDKHWTTLLKRLESIDQHHPVVPVTLQAELRDYQIEGYTWLSRLAYWGAGACLADDMGLGKTLQALVLALEHADKGPILIIAPTSVCYNWQNEIQRFAPTLEIKLFDSNDKATLIDNLKPHDILICSYHFLQQEIQQLTRITWQLAILDEGQAIKNFSTKRAQAAFQLQAHARVILSGTPIENHIGELWSLFRFLNPGLLGSREAFQNRFIAPIERDKDVTARLALKRLIQPFILRRNKTDVLTELPARTDQTIYVAPSVEEIAFYEALRRQALANIEDLKDTNRGRRQLHILSEITRLKRACCHPALAVATSTVGSSKLAYFLELIEELRENNHRALVFSQYVGFLKKVQEALEANNITYQYLDGQTPVAKRQQQIDEFQSGKGELFLISLKAGGMGLNLTAADYVIHLDPWWNPAVEDQASDRAHRIGQTRPVTIYRLIVKNTIEEKILQMHQNKRNLASDLLSGSEVVSKMTEEELLTLIKT